MTRYVLRFVALGYLAALLIVPVGLVVQRAFADGLDAFWAAITTPEALHALYLTIVIALIAVSANTVFGILCALAIVRRRFRGHGLVNSVVDLPRALSPVVVGLALVLVCGRKGWWGGWLDEQGIQVIFALPGMVLATIFVSLPFVVREVHVEERFQSFDLTAAYASSVVLALLAVTTLLAMTLLRREESA